MLTARSRVCSVRCLAAVTMWRVLSARIGCPGAGVFLDLADHAVKVGEDPGRSSRRAGLAVVAAGDVDQGERAAALFAQLGQELGAGGEPGQVRQALACGQRFWIGSPHHPLGRVWVAMP